VYWLVDAGVLSMGISIAAILNWLAPDLAGTHDVPHQRMTSM
jgi:hypothetical protein